MFRYILHTSLYAFVASAVISLPVVGAEVPEKLKPWLGPQSWQRDTDGPIVSLGERGKFDDTHIFAPAVIREDGRYLMANEPSKTPAAAGEESADQANATLKIDPQGFPAWQSKQQARLRKLLGIPAQRVPLEAAKRGEIEWDGIVIEKWVFTSEPGSRISAGCR